MRACMLTVVPLISSKFKIILLHWLCACVCVRVSLFCHADITLTTFPADNASNCAYFLIMCEDVCCEWLQSTWWIRGLLCICLHACECACTDVFCVCVSNFAKKKKASSSSWLTFQPVRLWRVLSGPWSIWHLFAALLLLGMHSVSLCSWLHECHCLTFTRHASNKPNRPLFAELIKLHF